MKLIMPVLPALKRYYHVFEPYVGYRVILCVALILFCSFLEGVGITLFYPLLIKTTEGTAVDDNRIYEFIDGMFTLLNVPLTVTTILGAIVALAFFKGFMKFFQDAYSTYLYSRVAKGLRHRMISAYSNMDYRYYITRNAGFLTNVITVEANTASGAFKFYLQIISGLVYVLSFLTLALFLDWRFTLIAAVFGTIAVYSLKHFSTLSRKYAYQGTAENSVMQGLLIQTIQSFKYLVSTARFGIFQKKIGSTVDTLTRLGYKIGFANAATRSIGEPLVILFLVGIIYYHVVMMNKSIALILISIILFQRIMVMMMNLQVVWQSFSATLGGLDMVSLTMEEIERNREPVEGEDFHGLKDGIEFKDVSFSYGENKLFDRLNIRIGKNQTIALVGESGSGKSTLVDLLTGLLKPDSGGITIDGKDLREINCHKFREHVGYVTQETIIFDDTVANNISFWSCDSKDEECTRKIRLAAGHAYCEEFIVGMPLGYESLIGDRGVRLSGGQRQRLAIARELFKQPDILILDEATSALDTDSENYIRRSIDGLRGRMTVVIIAHRLSTIKNCDYLYVLKNGNIIEEGTFDGLISDGDSVFSKMCQMQHVSKR